MTSSLSLSKYLAHNLCFFFFQAEDGIRDIGVTGVQTCALPILENRAPGAIDSRRPIFYKSNTRSANRTAAKRNTAVGARSEERRVGKEGRDGWWRYHAKKKKI